ncbi:MAG: 3-dehydroquinate synthase [Clostridiales bacterium]|nr:3-dehydroquinate synthase [Clostridiales bacterium]
MNNIENIVVDTGTTAYPIYFADDFGSLAEAAEKCGYKGRKLCIITDNNVGGIYAETIKREMEKVFSEVKVCTFKAGEKSKTLDTIRDFYEFLLENKFDRKSVIAGLGGGVAGDMAGFAAASFMRGVDFIQIPTTLLAQVDSSVGGKVGVDLGSYKNVVGAFYQPKFVYINTSSLDTLPKREFSAGMAEVIKYGIIQSEDFYKYIIENKEKIKSFDKEYIRHIIRSCCEMKAVVVSKDEHDTGLREILNYGHTIGHAVEGLKGFELLHGECVAIGMAAVTDISVKRGYIGEDKLAELKELLKFFDLPVSVSGLKAENVYEQLFHDKKVSSNKLKFVIADSVGSTIRTSDVAKDEVMAAINSVIED